ncbi:MAG: hypothetical protein A4E62_01188 [Syntrophorhabdus sp. PtaU1.Bin002]|nr:MAG: hypothetical protein A4E58_03280 [Syntrophorhabdus sp. PtaB.Bin006]OPY71568.1 MAG: hypothetical protein A4E62_01188 [Syntrophorhabdus sp. PtaU1.Bin002]
MRKLFIVILALVLVSCSSIPFLKKKPDNAGKTTAQTKTEKTVRIEDQAPKAGDIKLVDGVEYIYARNRRYMFTPYEPEYVWIRKDEYSPRMGENLLTKGGMDSKERKELEKRMAKLEEEMRKKGLPPQMAYPTQMVYMPTGMGYMSNMPLIAFTYPSPKMKRRVIVLPVTDRTNYRQEHLGELATKRLISRLENTGAIICIDPNSVNMKGDLLNPRNMKTLNELHGVQAVLNPSLSDVFTSTSKIEGKDERETSFAVSKMGVDVYNTDTGSVMRQLSGRNPVFLSREKGDLSSEKAKIKAIDLSIEIIADDMLKAILTLDWHGRIASVDKEKVYLNAGRLSGLEKGGVVEVYSPGDQIIDPKTNTSLGTTKGIYKGDLEVVELFGVDASWAKVKKGGNFSATDLVYLKSAQDGTLLQQSSPVKQEKNLENKKK